MKGDRISAELTLPRGGGTLVGRAWLPQASEAGEPRVVAVADGRVFDLSARFRTFADLLNCSAPGLAARPRTGLDAELGPLARFLDVPLGGPRPKDHAHLLAPCDLQPVKASGVTFLVSLKERVIEEAARGDPARAAELRGPLGAELERRIAGIVPGSAEADKAKAWLVENRLWSQYLEVAIGPDAEIFTKAAPLSAVGTGADVGILRHSHWNNPEPEIVLAVNAWGAIVGATLGNDVNLRDVEGRSGLLLGKAKDNNASCAVGPLIRLFDESFGLDDIRRAEVSLEIDGADGFTLRGVSQMHRISRDPEDLVRQAMGAHHQYPDGVMLFLGTMFAPSQDRGEPGRGFTHHVGDTVAISSPCLGTLVNRVDYCDTIEPWSFGIAELIKCLVGRSRL